MYPSLSSTKTLPIWRNQGKHCLQHNAGKVNIYIIYCEYVVRLVVTLSEMADTISSNVTILKDSIRNIDKSKIVREVEKMYEAVKMFNTRSEFTVTNSHVHQLLKYEIRDGEEQTDDTFVTFHVKIYSNGFPLNR